MLRVLHCIYDDPSNPWVGGGGALRVWEIYRRLLPEVAVTVATGNYPAATDELRDGVSYVRLGSRSSYLWSRLTYARAAERLLARGDYDVAVSDFSVYTPLRPPPNRPVGFVVHMLHGPTAAERWGRLGGHAVAAIERRALRPARWVSTTSRWMQQQLLSIVGPGARIQLVGSGVPDEFFEVVRDERSFLLYYGRFDLFQKGLDLALRAFAVLSRAHPGLELVIAGRGKDAADVLAMARDLGIVERIRLLDGVTRSEVLRLFAGARAMLVPSRFEGLPMAPAEAMAAGVPVVAADVGALSEIIESPDVGLLVPPGDVDAMSRAVSDLLYDTERRREMSVAARRSAARFSWDRVARQHLEFLTAIARESGTFPTADTQS